MTTLYITRHGETLWNTEHRMQGWHDSPLTEKGIKQATLLGERLKDTNIDVIYCSDLGRTFKTAELVRGGRNIDIIPDKNLREINIGNWEGYNQEEIKKINESELFNFWKKPHLFKPDGGENFKEVRDRVWKEVNKIVKENEGKTILIVTHTIALKSIMSCFEKREIENLWEPPVIYQTSLSKVEIDGTKIDIDLYGDASHIHGENTKKQVKAV